MNNLLSLNSGGDTAVHSFGSIVALAPRGFVPHNTGDRLRAFKTHFVPTRETLGQRIDAVLATVGIYAVVATAFRVLGTADLTPVLQALHLNGA